MRSRPSRFNFIVCCPFLFGNSKLGFSERVRVMFVYYGLRLRAFCLTFMVRRIIIIIVPHPSSSRPPNEAHTNTYTLN